MRSSRLLVRIRTPMLLREGVVGECLLDRRFHQLGGAAQAQATQLLDHSNGLLACCREVLAGVDRLEPGCDLPHLGRGHVAEDVAIPVHYTPLPGSLKNSAALSASPMQASEVISRTPFNPRSLNA